MLGGSLTRCGVSVSSGHSMTSQMTLRTSCWSAGKHHMQQSTVICIGMPCLYHSLEGSQTL
eukprot:11072153-Prorocentrum_lima.AAC.1